LKPRTYCLYLCAALQVLAAIYAAVFSWHGAEPSQTLLSTADFWSLILLMLWLDADSSTPPGSIFRSYDFGLMIYVLWPFCLPFYLWRTRRFRGMAMFVMVLGLFWLPYAVQWLIYALHNTAE
jgi:hypothetical protein